MLGFRMQAVGRFEEANEFFRRSLKSNPEQGASYWGLIQGKRMGRDEGKEISTIIKVAENPHLALGERAYAYYSVGKIHADLGEYGSAMEFYDHANALTAKGRFGSKGFDASAYAEGIRRTTAIFSKEFIAGHQGLGTVSSTPIFIVGMMRSGTTLMEQILSSHPTVTAGGELRFWLERGPRAVDPQQGRIDPDLARRLIEDYEALLSRFSEAGHVTDKMPENAQMLGLIHTLFPNAKIIHMNRNPVDVCLSIYFTPYELSPVFGHVKENIVFAYRKHLELMDHWRTVLPSGAFLDVSYEELVDDSATTIRAVLDYCDLEWDEACLRHQENGRAVNTPSVWQVRQPIYKNSKEKWRNYEGCLGAFSGLVSSLK
jgi:tetratricopeptide (TPR) repeat protein